MLELCLGDVAGGCFRITAGGIVSLIDAGKIKNGKSTATV